MLLEQTVAWFGQTSTRTFCFDPALAQALVQQQSSFTCVVCAFVEEEENNDEGDEQSPFFENGINGLYVGHSFFQPIAASFDALARAQNSATEGVAFPNHQFDSVFASGMSGLPGRLWDDENTRTMIENKLKSGTVGLFGMNTALEDTALEDYSNWIDLALLYNDQTSFLIGMPYLPNGPNANAEFYKSASETASAENFTIIEELRTRYPSTRILFIDYGYTAAIMKEMFESNILPDIESMTPQGTGTIRTALFADAVLGHAGPMMEDMCALIWMNILYGVDYADLQQQQQLDYESSSVTDIVAQVMDFNMDNEYN